MTTVPDNTRSAFLRAWYTWAGLLLLLYAVSVVAGWQRTLIGDEIRPLLIAARPPGALLEFARQDLVQTPGSYIVSRVWLDLFGHTDAAAKALPVVVNAATVVLFTYFTSQVMSGWRVATALFLVPFLRVGSAVNLVRMYGLLLMFVVLALVCWFQYRRAPRLLWLVAWVGALTAAVYAHASALLVIPAFVAAEWIRGRRSLQLTAAAAIPALSLLPWIGYVRGTFERRGITANVEALFMDPERAVLRLPFFLLNGEDPGGGSPLFEVYRQGIDPGLLWTALVLHGLLLAAAAAGAARLLPSGDPTPLNEERPWFAFALAAVALPVLALYGFSIAVVPAIHARYLLAAAPGYAMLLVFLARLGGRPGAAVLGAIGLWLAVSIGVAAQLHHQPSAARSGADLLDRRKNTEDVVLIGNQGMLAWQLKWEWTRRLRRTDPLYVLPTPGLRPWVRDVFPDTPLDALPVDGAERVWFFHAGRRNLERVSTFLASRGFAPATDPESTSYIEVFVRSPP